MRWLLCVLLCVRSLAYAADSGTDCDHLNLVLDPHLTKAVVDQHWETGESPSKVPAKLELRGCKGELLDHMELDASLARLDNSPLRGTPVPTYLVTVDLTAPAGSYSGPATMPIEVENHKLKLAEATAEDGKHVPITLAMTGKAAWKKVAAGKTDDFLAVNCQPQQVGEFATSFRRYHLTQHGWQVSVRSEPIFWESDGDFPEASKFPAIANSK